jgi:hypothetical protein
MSDGVQFERDSVSHGVNQGILLHLFQILLVPIFSFTIPLFYSTKGDLGLTGFVFALSAWSLTQFLYIGPAIAIAYRSGSKATAKGLILVASIGILLNGACDALIWRH